jgi:hypothetical protein
LFEGNARAQSRLWRLLWSPHFSPYRFRANTTDNHPGSMDRSSKIASIFLGLFALPFCGFGIAALVTGIRNFTNGEPVQSWVLAPFGLVFSAIGFTLLAAAVLGPRKMRQANLRQQANPDQPWLWRDDWAQGRAKSKTKSSMVSAWTFAVLWNLVSIPVLFAIPARQFQRDPKTLLALVFPLAGIALLVWALRETVRWMEFGKTCFEMNAVPCVVGREFRGNIQTRFPHLPERGIHLQLTCVNRVVTGSGNNRSTQEKILWRDEKTVSAAELCPGPTGTTIPVSFRVPLEAQPTDTSNPQNSIVWMLEADADVPGVNYRDFFELPVFRTKDTPQAEETDRFASAEVACSAPAHPTIVVRPASGGGTEFYFPAARNPGFAMGISGFTLLWSGFIWIMLTHRAPVFFPIIFGLFDLLMAYIALKLWLGTSRVVIGSGQLRVRSGILGMGAVQEIPFSQISAIKSAITAQQGGSAGTPYYDIQLMTANGRKVTLGSTLRDKQETDWLIAEITRLTGMKPAKAAVAGAS